MKNILGTQCLNILKKPDIQNELKIIFQPIIELLLNNVYPYIYLIILLVLLIFLLILLILILQVYILLRFKNI
jgi:hypothetical protein